MNFATEFEDGDRDYKMMNARDFYKLEKARALLTSILDFSGLQNCKIISFHCLKPLSL